MGVQLCVRYMKKIGTQTDKALLGVWWRKGNNFMFDLFESPSSTLTIKIWQCENGKKDLKIMTIEWKYDDMMRTVTLWRWWEHYYDDSRPLFSHQGLQLVAARTPCQSSPSRSPAKSLSLDLLRLGFHRKDIIMIIMIWFSWFLVTGQSTTADCCGLC